MARSINKSESRSLLRSLPQKDWVCSEGCFIFGVCGGGGGNSAHCLHCLGCQQLGGVTEKKVLSGVGFLAQRKAFFFFLQTIFPLSTYITHDHKQNQYYIQILALPAY